MRDIKRIDPFLKKLQELWEIFPDYRFGQIIYMLATEMGGHDINYQEEGEWLEAIERILNKDFVIKKKKKSNK